VHGLITAKRIRHLPVFDNKEFVGLVSIGDVVKAIISEQERLIEQLSNYIAGKYV
jgi:CBS domain-containing protein